MTQTSSPRAMVLIPLVLVHLLSQATADAVSANECRHYTSSDEPTFMGRGISDDPSSKVTRTYIFTLLATNKIPNTHPRPLGPNGKYIFLSLGQAKVTF